MAPGRTGDQTEPGHHVDPAAEEAPPTTLRVLLPAVPAAELLMRGGVRRWLRALRWPAAQLGDLLLAASEAVRNSIEHAYAPRVPGHRSQAPGLVEIEGQLQVQPNGYRLVELTVRDYGCWRPLPVRNTNRRHGIPLMRACMDDVSIKGTNHGTETRLRSRPVPPAATER